MKTAVKSSDLKTLSRWNYVAAIAHFIAALYSLFFLGPAENRTVQLVDLAFDGNNTTNSKIDIPVVLADSTNVDLKFVVVGFFGVTSLAHLLYATDFFGLKWYSKPILGFGWNPYRWIEYSISAGLMIYLISIASGSKDQVQAVSNALITPSLMISGWTNERALQQNDLSRWSRDNSIQKPNIDKSIVYSNFFPAWGLFAVHWYIILSNYSRLSRQAKDANKPLDAGITFMVFSQLIFFSMFGVVQSYQVFRWTTSRPGRIEPMYITYEKVYIVLSAVTKLLLAGTVAYALR